MKNFSMTQSGILVAVVGTLLTRFGFSEVCSNELLLNTPLLIGGVWAWIGRIRAGGINVFGFKK